MMNKEDSQRKTIHQWNDITTAVKRQLQHADPRFFPKQEIFWEIWLKTCDFMKARNNFKTSISCPSDTNLKDFHTANFACPTKKLAKVHLEL